MELIRGQHNIEQRHRGCVLTIGNFDGLHLGHRAVLQQLQALARQQAAPGMVMIFEPQPLEYFTPATAPARLNNLREKVRLLEPTGIDYLLCLRFDARLAALSAADFVGRLLVERLAVQAVIIGDDFRFGHKRAGNFASLQQLGEQHGFTVNALETCRLHGERVSSTRVRSALAADNLAQATELLGRPYRILGRVMHGDKRGRELGVPTLNVDLKRNCPALEGVFVTRVHGLEDNALPAISYIGKRQLFGCDKQVLETHVFDYAAECYGCHVEIEFLERLRPAQDFTRVVDLQQQMQQDMEQAKEVLNRM